MTYFMKLELRIREKEERERHLYRQTDKHSHIHTDGETCTEDNRYKPKLKMTKSSYIRNKFKTD